uniref:Cytochrome c biogenesis protein CcsA n=1 Tax=Azolla caroliniana TaxID=39631 RepID=A0A291R7K5_9MONI|nr:cytochrome c heme attachment protein [Azolla caroliniana]ATL58610.1 cytochrome c heme attachment protein [Azolla caroliniana]
MTYIDIEYICAHISFIMLLVVTSLHWIVLSYKSDKLNNLINKGMAVASLRITGFLLIRWIETKHLPLSNLYESSMFLSWSFSLLYILLKIGNQNEWSGAVVAPGATSTHAFATSGLPEEIQRSTQLVPASQSHWLMMHVSTTLPSYATPSCGSLSAIALPIIYFDRKTGSFVYESNRGFSQETYVRASDTTFFYSDQRKADVERPFFYLLSPNLRKCRLVNQLDQWAYNIISLGFSLSTIGILSGAVWANEAWGSYRSWDPKETWALVTWLIHAIYLHTKMTQCWGKEGPAIVASIGFFLVRIRFLGVNLLGIGLHNHGWLAQQ